MNSYIPPLAFNNSSGGN